MLSARLLGLPFCCGFLTIIVVLMMIVLPWQDGNEALYGNTSKKDGDKSVECMLCNVKLVYHGGTLSM